MIFSENEIIVIVMAFIKELSLINEINQIDIDEISLPKPIRDKIGLLNNEEYIEFSRNIELIVNDVYEFKSGELNELNNLHMEIKYLIKKMS